MQIYTWYKYIANDQEVSTLLWETPVASSCSDRKVCMHLANARQFVVSRAHATFAEVTESVNTFQELIKVDTVLHVFKNVTFSDVGCTLCNESYKSLHCLSLCSIIELEVSSSASPNDSSSSFDSCSRSPNRQYGSCRRCYLHGSCSTSRSPRHFDRGYSPEIDYSHGRDYCYHSPDRDNYRDRQYSPSYYGRRYNNSNGFSPDRSYSQDRYPNQYQNVQVQGHYQGSNQRTSTNRYNNEGNGWNQGSQCGRKNLYRQQPNYQNNQPRQSYMAAKSQHLVDMTEKNRPF